MNEEITRGNYIRSLFKAHQYVKIMEMINTTDVSKDKEFQKIFKSFYSVRFRTDKWYLKYFQLMQEQKDKKRNFKEILLELQSVEEYENFVEASFASKLIATVDDDCAIWDSHVLSYLGLEKKWRSFDEKNIDFRIDEAVELYGSIQKEVKKTIKADIGREWMSFFDELYPCYKNKISDVKKMDYYLWLIG